MKKNNIELYIHVIIWLVLGLLPFAFYSAGMSKIRFLSPLLIQILFFAILYYTNYFLLVDNYLFSKKTRQFIVLNVVLILSAILCKHLVSPSFDTPPPDAPEGMMRREFSEGPMFSFIVFIDLVMQMLPIAFAITIKSYKKMTEANFSKKEVEKKQLQSELQQLKYQLHPHFFFNSLNNIYSLIDFDPEKAKEIIHDLSKLMRHLLQRSEVESNSLQEEVDFLMKYINLMRLRLGDRVPIEVDFPKDIPEISLPPLLFISIVENAFKHGVSASRNSSIFFGLYVENQEVIFVAKNQIFSKNQDDLSGSGIGVENLTKRLELIYPNSYNFSTNTESGIYTVNLTIKLG